MFVPSLQPPDGDDVLSLASVHIAVRGTAVAVARDRQVGRPDPDRAIFLGILDGCPCWAVDAHDDADDDDEPLLDLRMLWGRLDELTWTVAGRAVQLVAWARTHRYCGQCATETVQVDGERARRCPACGLMAFPRLAPAVIALIERDDNKVLLGRNRAFPMPLYSCLAGFVEPGETLEQAVVREVREEVGVTVGDVRYFGSQPWPFPHSLMVGFNARWVEGDIVIDETEIVDAGWFGPEELPTIPGPMSIARHLIDDWLERSFAS